MFGLALIVHGEPLGALNNFSRLNGEEVVVVGGRNDCLHQHWKHVDDDEDESEQPREPPHGREERHCGLHGFVACEEILDGGDFLIVVVDSNAGAIRSERLAFLFDLRLLTSERLKALVGRSVSISLAPDSGGDVGNFAPDDFSVLYFACLLDLAADFRKLFFEILLMVVDVLLPLLKASGCIAILARMFDGDMRVNAPFENSHLNRNGDSDAERGRQGQSKPEGIAGPVADQLAVEHKNAATPGGGADVDDGWGEGNSRGQKIVGCD